MLMSCIDFTGTIIGAPVIPVVRTAVHNAYPILKLDMILDAFCLVAEAHHLRCPDRFSWRNITGYNGMADNLQILLRCPQYDDASSQLLVPGWKHCQHVRRRLAQCRHKLDQPRQL